MSWLMIDVLVFGALGAILGRWLFVPLLVASPIVCWWIWSAHHYRGEGDDVTGPVAGVSMIFGLVAVVIGIAIHQLARWLFRSRRSSDPSTV
jgi:hypothetical protein